LFADHENYVKFTRPFYAKNLKFPFNYYTPGQYRREAIETLMNRKEENEEKISSACKSISIRLKAFEKTISMRTNGMFFYGKLSMVDICLFSYLYVFNGLGMPEMLKMEIDFPFISVTDAIKRIQKEEERSEIYYTLLYLIGTSSFAMYYYKLIKSKVIN
jgi:hypothetical protein